MAAGDELYADLENEASAEDELYNADLENESSAEDELYKLYNADLGNESSDEDELFLSLEIDTTTREKLEREKFPYKVLTTEQVMELLIDSIHEINTVVQMPRTTTRILLHHFKWDKEMLYERYYDGDLDALFKEAHIINPYKKPPNFSSKYSPFLPSTEECEICFRDIPKIRMIVIACGHRFCTECWRKYLTTEIMDQGMCQITCAAHGCDILVDDQTAMSRISDPKVQVKYDRLITNDFVECNRLLRWCPQLECNRAVAVKYVGAQPVTCLCRHKFCFACGENWHDPLKCNILKKWQKKCADRNSTTKRIATDKEECPECKTTVEKNGGSNHMECKYSNCRFRFCWICLRPLGQLDLPLHICNRYSNGSDVQSANVAGEKSHTALNRFLFYYERYHIHKQSLRFEQELYASVKGKMEEILQHKMSCIEVQFLKIAVDILCHCRETLMYTYVLAYYLKTNHQSEIFEHNQQDLESSTEILTQHLEQSITQENILDMKQKVQDKYRYCERLSKALLRHAHEGYKKDLWEYTD